VQWQGGNGASFGAGGGGGYYGGGGGGVAPGIVGGGGGGSAFADKTMCCDVVFLQGNGWKPGGFPEPQGGPEQEGEEKREDLATEKDDQEGSSFAKTEEEESVSSSGGAWKPTPGAPYLLPDATGLHELDKVGGKVGEGGRKSLKECRPGKHGAVRILRPGFYDDFDPTQNLRPYMNDPRRQVCVCPLPPIICLKQTYILYLSVSM